MGNVKKSVAKITRHKRRYDSRMNERHMQSKEGKVDSSKALDASLVVTECNAIESKNSNSEHAFNKSVNESSGIDTGKQYISSSSKNYITHAVDADIRPENDQVPFAEVQFTAQYNVLANEQQHTEQSEPIYDTIWKPVLQPLRNQSVVRQLTAFRSERPKFSTQRFASQVDVNNVLSKPVTPHYFPKVRESVFVKPNHVIASGSSRNSSKESYGSNDMAHNYYLEEAKKKSQDKNMNLKPSVMHTTSLQSTTNGSKRKSRSNNQTSRCLSVSKSSCGMSNVESVGSSFPRVILISSIFVEVSVAPKMGTAAVASPTMVLELDTHSSSEANPSKSSPPPVSVASMVSPFLDPYCLILPAPPAIVAPSYEFPLAPVVALPRIRQRRAILIRPGEDIPIGRLYYTHPGGPCKALTVRKSVRPLPSHRLALRYTSDHLDHFTSGSSSSHSSSDHSSSGYYSSGHSLSRNTSPYTTDVDSSTPQRLVYPPLARTPQDSSSESSAGPSRKRCRSPTSTVTSSIHFTRALVPSRADLIPPQDIKADATAVEVAVDRDVEAGIDAGIGMEVDVRINVDDEVEDEVKSSDKGTIEVGVDMDAGIDIPDGMLMPNVVEHLEQRERAGLSDRTRSLERENLKVQALLSVERDQVDSLRCHMALSQEEFRQFCRDRDDTRMRLRRLESFVERCLGFRP
nr:hypothetical protein [Tanacetum cinerariifolium]